MVITFFPSCVDARAGRDFLVKKMDIEDGMKEYMEGRRVVSSSLNGALFYPKTADPAGET